MFGYGLPKPTLTGRPSRYSWLIRVRPRRPSAFIASSTWKNFSTRYPDYDEVIDAKTVARAMEAVERLAAVLLPHFMELRNDPRSHKES
jgi:hypothetical protein